MIEIKWIGSCFEKSENTLLLSLGSREVKWSLAILILKRNGPSLNEQPADRRRPKERCDMKRSFTAVRLDVNQNRRPKLDHCFNHFDLATHNSHVQRSESKPIGHPGSCHHRDKLL